MLALRWVGAFGRMPGFESWEHEECHGCSWNGGAWKKRWKSRWVWNVDEMMERTWNDDSENEDEVGLDG